MNDFETDLRFHAALTEFAKRNELCIETSPISEDQETRYAELRIFALTCIKEILKIAGTAPDDLELIKSCNSSLEELRKILVDFCGEQYKNTRT